MRRTEFDNKLVEKVSLYLQEYMQKNKLDEMNADECAKILAIAGVLPNDVGPKPGFNFRQMLRDGRDGLILRVVGASQSRPNTRWRILRA